MNHENNSDRSSDSDDTLLCARCVSVLKPGHGEHFEVQIRAVADPSPPVLEDLADQDVDSLRGQFEALIHQADEISETEAREQVMRQLTICLCNRCFFSWIENPAGSGD